MTTWEQERAAFTAAAGWFADTAAAARGHEEAPGLGEWSVRDLLGHTSRSLTTVEQYRREGGGPVEVTSAAGYFSALAEAMRAPGVAQRGRDAGAALGPDPAASVAALAERVVALVGSWGPDAAMATPAGGMLLGAYLPTRTFELTVHTCDLAVALGQQPVPPPAAAVATLHLVGELAVASGGAGDALLALTGRRPLPEGFTVL